MTWGDSPGHIAGVTAITEVLGDGQKLTAVAMEYDTEVDGTRLSASRFSVAGRTVTAAYANTKPAKSPAGCDGRYVVLELDPADPEASLIVHQGRSCHLRAARVEVAQTGEVATAAGGIYPPDGHRWVNDRIVNLVVDDFQQFAYTHPATGLILPYNLFIPVGYDRSRSYPLVTFIHDLMATSPDPRMTLTQGLGAVVWATPAEQAKHECFVLAPQYPVQLVDDDSNASEYLEVTVDLMRSLAAEYNLDTDRLYGTGQSGGCMSFIHIGIKYPGLLAASLLVAGQWDPTLVAPLAKDNLWIVVAEGDLKAFPGMNAITAALEQAGARVSRATWSGRATPAEYSAAVERMLAEGANVMYTVLQRGTVVWPGLPEDGGSNHVCTWRIAYQIEGIRDWLFRQRRPSTQVP